MTNWKKGDKCEIQERNSGALLKDCEILYIDCRAIVISSSTATSTPYWLSEVEIKPIKTDVELERERVVERIMFLIGLSEEENISVVRECLTFAFDLGYISDPEKRVKPLSLSIFSKAWFHAGSVDEHYESLKYLGYIQGVDNDA